MSNSFLIGTLETNTSLVFLPPDFVTQTAAILARKRVGKTYTASVIAEELAENGHPFVVLDPTGAWWGLRSKYPVVIIGGAHGDVPLEATAGAVIADLVVDNPGFYIIDLSQTASEGEQDRFATAFAERLYRAKEKARFPLHLFVDEADSFAPQKPYPQQMRMLGAFEAIVRRGGIRGLGMTMITQRPAVLNKNVLTQCEVLIVLQMTAPQDQNAIEAWVERNGTKEECDRMINSLASLQMGHAWLWSPSWLQVFQRILIRTRKTFNSSATPKVGEKVKPTTLMPVDLAKLGEQIKATVETAKANDPLELRKEIAALKKQLAEKDKHPLIQVSPPEIVKINVIDQSDHARLEEMIHILRKLVDATEKNPVVQSAIKKGIYPGPSAFRQTVVSGVRVTPSSDSVLTASDRKVMTVLAQYPDGKDNYALATLSGYTVGGRFNNILGALRSKGYVDRGQPIKITQEGLNALGDYEQLPTGDALRAYWLARVGGGERKILSVLFDVYPNALNKEEIAERSDYQIGGRFNNIMGHLRTMGLIEGRGAIKASDTLFLA